MPVVQFHCPHCGGLFQIDESLSGQHVSCPLCASVVVIPDLGSAPAPTGFPPPPPELGHYPSPSAPEESLPLGCPVCSGVFQVTRSMGGQQVACPHCHSAVLLPDFQEPHSPAPLPPTLDTSTPAAPTFAHSPLTPTETPYTPAPATLSPSPVSPSPAVEPDTRDDELLPPTTTGAPGSNPRERHQENPSARETKSSKPSRPRTGTAAASREKADDLLPPTAKKRVEPTRPVPASDRSEVDELLPPGVSSPKPATKERSRSEVDELLPPSAEKPREPKTKPKETVEEAYRPIRPGVAADGSILVPTDDGNYIALREPIKTVSKGNREVELRRLSPEEKARRRFKRNLLVAAFGMVFLILTMWVMAYLNGAF